MCVTRKETSIINYKNRLSQQNYSLQAETKRRLIWSALTYDFMLYKKKNKIYKSFFNSRRISFIVNRCTVEIPTKKGGRSFFFRFHWSNLYRIHGWDIFSYLYTCRKCNFIGIYIFHVINIFLFKKVFKRLLSCSCIVMFWYKIDVKILQEDLSVFEILLKTSDDHVRGRNRITVRWSGLNVQDKFLIYCVFVSPSSVKRLIFPGGGLKLKTRTISMHFVSMCQNVKVRFLQSQTIKTEDWSSWNFLLLISLWFLLNEFNNSQIWSKHDKERYFGRVF